MAETRDEALDTTLNATPAASFTVPAPPVALGSGAGRDDHAELGATLDSGSQEVGDVVPNVAGSGSSVRSGTSADYPNLIGVEPSHYVRVRELARGGMGRIIVARDRRLGREVAIKELYAPTGELKQRFEREARITARLQHPATVSLLEAGVWPTGEPFYAMTLIAGRPLDKVIVASSTAEARFGLIANVIAVADAIAYAHDRKIVHRDLKPANVLVGDFGETVVIDWGLAKDLTAVGTDAEPVRPSARQMASHSASGGDATEHGAVLGTPAYMPPEQAEGYPVDQRADVYALGALLYHVLAGEPPYTGSTADSVLADVIAGPPPPLASRVPQAPPDLVTIVEKAMARSPSDRFPTAKELVAELRKFQTGQLVGSHRYSARELFRRWVRKHRTNLAVAGAALVALAVIGVLSVRNVISEREAAKDARAVAEQQRALAVRRDHDTQELLAFMLGDLHDRLQTVGKLELLEAVARKASTYYDELGDEGRVEDQLHHASAFQAVGDVLLSKSDLAGARAAFDKARTLMTEVVRKQPSNPHALTGLAQAESRLASVASGETDPKAAQTHLRTALGVLERALRASPDDNDAGLAMAAAQRELGDTLVDLGDGSGAGSAYRAGITLATARLATKAADNRWKRVTAILHSQLAGLLVMQADLQGALREENVDLSLSEQLVAASPADTGSQNNLAGAHLRLGDMLKAKGDAPAALAEFRASLAVMKHLTSIDPNNDDWTHDRTACHDRIGNLLLESHDLAGARAEYEAARDLRQHVVDRDPTSAMRRDLATSHNKLGSVFEAERKPAAALGEYERGLTTINALATAQPDNKGLQRDLGVSFFNTGDMLFATGRATESLARHRASLAIVIGLAAKDPTNALWQADVIESHQTVAKVLAAMRRSAEATTELEAALDLAEAARKQDPTNPTWPAYLKQTQDLIKACCAQHP